MTQTIEQTIEELTGEFAFLDDWMDRYQLIIDMGKSLDDFPSEWQVEDLKVQGCQSQVWLHADREGDKMAYAATSDAAIVRGLIAMLLTVYNHRTPTEILATPPDFIKDIGLDAHLTPGRSNGLHAMVAKIFDYARAAQQGRTEHASP